MPIIKLRDGERLHITCIGRGKPVVLLHGFGSQGRQWLPNVLPLVHRYRFYLPDLRGFGASHFADFSNPCVFSTYANDLEDIFNHFRLNHVILGGLSTGAYTCLAYNKLYGFSRVKKYLHIEHGSNSRSPCGTQGIFKENQAEMFSRFDYLQSLADRVDSNTPYWDLPEEVRIALRDTMASVFRYGFNRKLSRGLVRFSSENFEEHITKRFFPVERWPIYLKIMAAFQEGFETKSALTSIQVPTTLMIGKHSRYFSYSTQMELAKQIPHSQVVLFENSGHIPMADEPLRFQKEFMRFLAQ